MDGARRYPSEPAGLLTLAEFNKLLLWAADEGASDLKLGPGRPVWARFAGEWTQVTRHALKLEELAALLNATSRTQSAHGKLIGGGGYFDYNYSVKRDRGEELRFRANATAANYHAQTSVEFTFRAIPPSPPRLEDIAMPEELIEPCIPHNGLVLVTGTMGSGKSTTIAALLRRILETQPRSVATYEAPIEFDLSGVDNVGPVSQSEVPRQFPSFDLAARNSARRASDVILIGEARDRETLRSGIEAAEIGSAVYATVHTMSVAATPSRILGVFPSDERPQIAATLFSALRVILHQRLIPKNGGGRVALREWLVFDRTMRESLAVARPEELVSTIGRWVEQSGHSLLGDASAAVRGQLIEEHYLHQIQSEMEGRGDVRA